MRYINLHFTYLLTLVDISILQTSNLINYRQFSVTESSICDAELLLCLQLTFVVHYKR